MGKKRADQLLAESGLAENRSKAKAMIMAGLVLLNEQRIEKAGQMLPEDATLRVKGKQHPYVSRGGVKLDKMLNQLKLDVEGFRCIDVGASTGGFTHCLLKRGAAKITAIDVGTNQLDYRLRTDERVTVMEKFNARGMTPENVGGLFQLAVIDVSFISLRLILPPVKGVMEQGGLIIALVKPQFEAGKKEVDKGKGVIKDEAVRQKVMQEVEQFATSIGLQTIAKTESPITGAKGNHEFLAAFST